MNKTIFVKPGNFFGTVAARLIDPILCVYHLGGILKGMGEFINPVSPPCHPLLCTMLVVVDRLSFRCEN